MQITSIEITEQGAGRSGLVPTTLTRLGDTVVLAGANGSGKTRFLQYLRQAIQELPTSESYNDAIKQIPLQRSEIRRFTRLRGETIRSNNKDESERLTQRIEAIEGRINQLQSIVQHSQTVRFEGVDGPLKPILVNTVPTATNLTDDSQFKRTVARDRANAVKSPGTGGLEQGTIAYIREVLDKWLNATHPETNAEKRKRDDAVSSRDALVELVRKFLNTELKRSIEGEPEVFGRPIIQAGLSKGQFILLQLCVQLHAQDHRLSNVILLLDEPENHLHPSACLELIRQIRNAAPDSQMWIATHSVPVLANLADHATLLFAEHGKISFAGNVPRRVLRTLLGDDDELNRLHEFCGLPSVLAMNRYAAECLLPPSVVGPMEQDDQTTQIANSIRERISDRTKLRILDYGAGKGRLLANIIHENTDILEYVDYYAFDPFEDDEEACRGLIDQLYGTSDGRYFSDLTAASDALDANSVDVVVLCNVFHEISPKNWISLFQENSLLTRLISDRGGVLFVEDEQIPVGERAHEYGFIVLGTAELKELFSVTEADTGFMCADQRGDGRLKAHFVPKECLVRISRDSRMSSLELRQKTAQAEIQRIRDLESSFRNGRLSGFWFQQFTNTSMALNEL